MADKYIQNKHNAPISCNAKDKDGKTLFTKKFMPQLTEKWSGKILTTGYEKLTEDEYKQLLEGSNTFKHYLKDLKLLVVHEDMPADLKTPHEALVDSRKEIKSLNAKIKGLESEIVELKAKLLDSEEKYKELSSATTDDEKFKSLNEQIEALTAERDDLRKANEEFKPVDESKFDGLLDEFVAKITESTKKDKEAQKLIAEFTAKLEELAKGSE